jgi:hypothetical protein
MRAGRDVRGTRNETPAEQRTARSADHRAKADGRCRAPRIVFFLQAARYRLRLDEGIDKS